MRLHTVPADTLDLVARGAGDMRGILRAGQRSKRLLLLSELMTAAQRQVPALFATAGSAHSFGVLAEAQQRAPHRVDALLLAPHVGAWASRCLRTLLTEPGPSPEELGHLGSVAAVAALHADLAFDVTAYVQDGTLVLPTLGAVRLPGSGGWCRIRARAAADGVEIVTAGKTTAVSLTTALRHDETVRPLRRLRSSADGAVIDILVDDVDPFRGCGHLPIAERLDPPALADWQDKLDGAWSLLVTEDRDRAEAIAAGISTVVPLRPTTDATELSATCHDSVGAIAVTPPRSPLALALALVHEFQHTKLSALLDLVPLLARSPDRTCYAPWRRDPRRLSGLMQGTYAYLGLTEFWDRHRWYQGSLDDEQPGGDWAHFEFAMGCHQVRQALGDLRASDKLTPTGDRFVTGMLSRIVELSRQPVPPLPRSLARLAALDHAASWRLRNLQADPEQTEDAARAWIAGRAGPRPGHRPARVVDGTGPSPCDGRIALLRRRLAVPDRWRPDASAAGTSPTATPADVLLTAGHFAAAADAYRAQIAARPDDLAAWAGLRLARHYAPAPGSDMLAERTEAVVAVHTAVRRRSGTSPDPEALAAWLAR